MTQIRRYWKLVLMVLMSILGSALPFILVAPVIRVAYKNNSRLAFWLAFSCAIAFLVLVGWVPIAISLMSITIMIGLFSEIFEKFKKLFIAGFIALVVSSLATVLATQQWLIYKGTTLVARLHEQIQMVLKQAHQMNSIAKLDPVLLIGQAPSVLVSLLILSLALALMFESSVAKFMKFPMKKVESLNLLSFKLPDGFIWVAMISFLFSFIDLGSKPLSITATNIVNVMVVFYFLQGLAVIETFFVALRFGFFIRFMTYVVFLIQLFFLVAAIGLIDFWVEFRKRFVRIRLNP